MIHKKDMRNAQPTAVVTFVVCACFLYGFFFLVQGDLDNAQSMAALGLIPYDSLYYVTQAEELDFENLNALTILLGGLNWFTLSYIFYVFEKIGSGSFAFLVINALSLYVVLTTSISLFPQRKYKKLVAIIIVLLSPYLIGWLLAPNKEILITAFVALIIKLVLKNRLKSVAVLSIIGGALKIQLLLAFILFLVIYKFPRRKISGLLLLSILLPMVLQVHPGLTMASFIDNQVDEVRTAEFFAALDLINMYPLGYVIVAPIRLMANLLAGGYPSRLLEHSDLGDLIAPATSFILAITFIFFIFKVTLNGDLKRYFKSNSDWTLYIHCLILVHLLVPFLQPRYFWWALPLMIAYIFLGGRPDKVVNKKNKAGVHKGSDAALPGCEVPRDDVIKVTDGSTNERLHTCSSN